MIISNYKSPAFIQFYIKHYIGGLLIPYNRHTGADYHYKYISCKMQNYSL